MTADPLVANRTAVARILFIEPFYSGSHRAFADGLAERSVHEIVRLTLPGGEWRKRMRRGAQELAALSLEVEGPFDAVVASDMLDLPAFLALTRPRLADTPVLYYLHENQFTYPRLKGTKLNSWFGQINYLSAVVADRVAFNSDFHRRDFIAALRTMADSPNNWLVEDSIGEIEAKSSVLPVGLDLARFDTFAAAATDGPPNLLWNHRWEFDKEPELFARAVRRLAEEGLDFAVTIAGEPGDNPSPSLAALVDAPGVRLAHFGYAASFDEYARLLWASDIAVSTSRQEFFGVAMVEAMYCGAFPVAPARLNYPDLIPTQYHGASLFASEEELVARLRDAIRSRMAGDPPLR
ncbi:MAG: DUF3524 domain-containing protein, partial [Dehalococcoidia bacterium]